MVVKDIVYLNEKSNIALVTLWTKKDAVLSRVKSREKIHAVGTLYTAYGVNYLIHTLAQKPQIDTLILFGADLSDSGSALLKLFNDGKVEGFKLMWSLDEVKPILSTVRVVDLRRAYEAGDWSSLEEAINKLYMPGVEKRPVLDLELKEVELSSWPLPISGFMIQEKSLFKAWVKAVYAVMKYGVVKESEYRERQKQVLNLVVSLNLYGASVSLEEFSKYFSRQVFEEHAESLLNPKKPEGVAYTYGERLNAHPIAGNQLEKLIDKLKRSSGTRRAVAVLWHHVVDLDSEDPPCIIIVQGDLSRGYYNHTVYIRSNDIYSAWPLNMYGQVKLAEEIASKIGSKLGVVTTISCSAHIYEHDWSNAWNLVHENYNVLSEFTPDPRGDCLIYLGSGEVVVEHRAPNGLKAGEIKLKSPRDYNFLKNEALHLSPDHAFYLGWETRRALERLMKGEKYVQDEDLP